MVKLFLIDFLISIKTPSIDQSIILTPSQVAAVVIDEHNGKVEVLSHRRGEKHIDINNAVHRAVKKTTMTNTTPSRSRSTPGSSNEG